jgi:hypothetical protein
MESTNAVRARPVPVTVACYLVAACSLLPLVQSLYTAVVVVLLQRAGAVELDGTAAAGMTLGIVVGAIAAVVGLALANGCRKGSNAARITTWVIGTLSMCMVSASAASVVYILSVRRSPLDFGWPGAFRIGLYVVLVATGVTAMVLLAVPSSNAFFRSAAEPSGRSEPEASVDPVTGSQASADTEGASDPVAR